MSPEKTAHWNTSDRAGRLAQRLFVSDAKLALFDQCLVSGGRFLATWLVGRLAGPEALGIYSMAMAGILLAGIVQESLIIRPFQTFYYWQSPDRQRVYSGSVLVQMLVTAVVICTGATLTSAVLHFGAGYQGNWGVMLMVVGLCVPGTLCGEFARRLSLARLQMRTAVAVDAAIVGMMVIGHVSLWRMSVFNAYSALGMIGFVHLVVGATAVMVLRREFRWLRSESLADIVKNLRFGGWLCGGQLLGLAHGYLVPWLVYSLIGAEAAGRLTACYTLVLFSNPLILGYSAWLGPQAARVYAEQGLATLRKLIRNSAILMGGGLMIFWGVLVVGGGPLLTWTFGEEYAGLGPIVGTLGATAIGFGCSVCGANGLAALQRPGIILFGTVTGIGLTLSLYFTLVSEWKLLGAAVALALGALVSGVIQLAVSLTAEPRRELPAPQPKLDESLVG